MTSSKLKQVLVTALILFSVMTGTVYAADKIILSGIESIHGKIVLNILKEAYAELGIEIEHKPYPILRSVKNADLGVVDGQLFKAAGVESDYPDLVRVPVPVDHIEIVAMTDKDLHQSPDWEELNPYKIGIFRGAFFLRQKAELHGLRVYEIETHEQMLKMLQKGRIDIVLIARIAGAMLLNKYAVEDIRLLSPPLQYIEVYHYLNIKNKHLIPKLASVLSRMEKSGRIAEIRKVTLQKEIPTIYNSFQPRQQL